MERRVEDLVLPCGVKNQLFARGHSHRTCAFRESGEIAGKALQTLVSRAGIEPATPGLKVRCSTF